MMPPSQQVTKFHVPSAPVSRQTSQSSISMGAASDSATAAPLGDVYVPQPTFRPPSIPAVASSSGGAHRPPPPPPEDKNRAVHRVRLAALDHNFAEVEKAASQQQCSVITVVKADGYGHGAIATALHLADICGADAFAVATLEEAIALRRGFEQNPPGRWCKQLASLFHTGGVDSTAGTNAHATISVASTKNNSFNANTTNNTTATAGGTATSSSSSSTMTRSSINAQQQQQSKHQTAAAVVAERMARIMRPPRIRILVLGPPVGFPRCFDDYYHYNIEVMVSGPEVAAALLHWVADEKERRRQNWERHGMEQKTNLLLQPVAVPTREAPHVMGEEEKKDGGGVVMDDDDMANPNDAMSSTKDEAQRTRMLKHPSSTLGNVSGQDLAREVRTLLMQQKAAVETSKQHAIPYHPASASLPVSVAASVTHSDMADDSDDAHSVPSLSGDRGEAFHTAPPTAKSSPVAKVSAGSVLTVTGSAAPPPLPPKQAFGGIEAMARSSRARAMQMERQLVIDEDKGSSDVSYNSNASRSNSKLEQLDSKSHRRSSSISMPDPAGRKRLRWHAVVDSGMGRLGFKAEPGETSERSHCGVASPASARDTVDIIKEMLDAEIHGNAPIEFFGMCTHMADACATSDYTNAQIARFTGLLQRVRAAGIFIPTVSTDNSAALLTTTLTHFVPEQILAQPRAAPTRGHVRTGGAIYGQRPAFAQLQAVSTLLASVRHVAPLKKGESCGYDRAYIAPYDVRIATLTIGFADGYPRELGNRVGRVQIRGAVFRVVGNVCMDMLMVELGKTGDLSNAGASVMVGDTAVLWGPWDEYDGEGMVRLQDLAATLGTTQSALTCGLDKIRVKRQFV